MKLLNNKTVKHSELVFKFMIYLSIAYVIYFMFIREYGMFLMMISSNIVAYIFDMHIINRGNYLEDVTLVSNIALYNPITHQVANAELPLVKVIVDRIMVVVTSSVLILAFIMLLVRSFKVLAVVLVVTLSVHLIAVGFVLTYFMFEASAQSAILTAYLQGLGVTQNIVDIVYFFSSLSYYYLKYFMVMFIAFYIWEKEGYLLSKPVKATLKKVKYETAYI